MTQSSPLFALQLGGILFTCFLYYGYCYETYTWTPSKTVHKNICGVGFSTGVPQGFLKHAVPDCLVRGTDLFSLRLSNYKRNDNSQHSNSHPL